MTERIRVWALRGWWFLTGRCLRFIPDERDVCVVCRVPPASPTPAHTRRGFAAGLHEIYLRVHRG